MIYATSTHKFLKKASRPTPDENPAQGGIFYFSTTTPLWSRILAYKAVSEEVTTA